jgi:hypothetical protein
MFERSIIVLTLKRRNFFEIIFINSVCTSQETHYVSSTRTSRLMVFRGTSRCLLWEPYGTHKYTVWAERIVRTSQETHYVSTTNPNQLMLFGEFLFTVRTIRNTRIHCVGRMQSSYFTGNTLCLFYKAQPVNAVWGNIRCLLWEPYGTHKYTCGQNAEFQCVKAGGTYTNP